MSQSELADKTGLQPSAISHFENDRRSPSFDNLKTLANVLNVPTDYLLGRTDSITLTGTTRDELFRHAENMSKNDLDTLTSFAAMLAQKAETKRKD
jgi:transcriptional regulator with XRE-family HTH domain